MFQMSTGQKYRRTNFEEDDNASAEDGTPTGVVYDPVMAFHAAQGSFCQRRTSLERLLFCTLILLSVVIIVLAILLSGHSHSTQSYKPSPTLHAPSQSLMSSVDRLCLTKVCVTVSSSILGFMDDTIDPCQDFYQYACGGWIKAHPIPPGESRWDTFGELRKENQLALKNVLESPLNESHSESERKAKVYFASCLDKNKTIETLAATPLLHLIRAFGGWTISNESGTFNLSVWNFQETLERLHGLGIFNFFSMWVGEDEKNPEINILQFDQSGLSLQRDQYINKTIHDDKILSAYLHFMTEIGVLLGGERKDTEKMMEKVIEFEQRVANITIPMEERRDNEKMYNKKSIKDLQRIAPFIDWLDYVNSILAVTTYKVNDSEKLLIKQPDYFVRVSHLLREMMNTSDGKIILHNYMMWHLVKATSSYLSKAFQDVKKEFLRVLYGTSGDEEMWRTCVADTEGVLGFAVGAMFVRETFHGDSKHSAETMIQYIKESFQKNLPKLHWMDQETIKAAIDKADAVTDMIGFPEFILNATLLDERYRQLIIAEDDYFKNNLQSLKYNVKQNLDKLRKQPDKNSWNMAPSTVNAYYTPTKNQIVFPAGILQVPFFDKDYPNSLNFGAMGVVMGHELTHGFDDQGREYDKNGVLRSWWNENSIETFKRQMQCMIDQYSNYTVHGENIRGRQTLGENIADNGGLKSAFYAYRKWVDEHDHEPNLPGLNLTQEQLFFVAFAQVWCSNTRPEDMHMSILGDPHSPHKFRVIGSLSNSKEFAEHFKCKHNSPMNPSNKCEVW